MMISAIVILLIIIFGAVICVKRRKSFLKNSLGNYNGKQNNSRSSYALILAKWEIIIKMKLILTIDFKSFQITTIYGLIPTGNTSAPIHLLATIDK